MFIFSIAIFTIIIIVTILLLIFAPKKKKFFDDVIMLNNDDLSKKITKKMFSIDIFDDPNKMKKIRNLTWEVYPKVRMAQQKSKGQNILMDIGNGKFVIYPFYLF